MKKNYILIAFLFSLCFVNAQDIDLEAETVRSTLSDGGKFVIANDDVSDDLKFLLKDTGEVNWYLDNQNFFIRDGDFTPYSGGASTVYDFFHIDGANGRIAFNYLSALEGGLTSSIHLNGTIATRVRTLDGTDDYDLLQDDHTIIVNLNSSAVTLTLPAASTCKGRQYKIKRDAEARNNARLTLDAADGGDIDDDPEFEISGNLGVCEVVSDGTQWWVLSVEEKLSTRMITGTATLDTDGGMVEVNFSANDADYTLTLPAAADYDGKVFTIKRNADGVVHTGNDVSIKPASGELLDNITSSSSYDMSNDFEAVTITSNGSRWLILNNYNH